MDGLKEANTELTAELDDVKQQLLSARLSARETGALLDEKERLKRERMAAMMAGFDIGGGELFSHNLVAGDRLGHHRHAPSAFSDMRKAPTRTMPSRLLVRPIPIRSQSIIGNY